MFSGYMKELACEVESSKTQKKVKNAFKPFLEFREITDIELRLMSFTIIIIIIKS